MARRTLAVADAEIETLRTRLMTQERLRFDADSRASEARIALEQFKLRAREVALRAKEDNNWCDDGFNEAMRELGLPRLPHTFKVKLVVIASREVEIDVDASDLDPENRTEEGVRNYLDDIDAVREYVSSNYGYDDWDVTASEIESVKAVTD